MKSELNLQAHEKYIEHQKEKTSDKARQKRWLNEEWQPKLDGFKAIFSQYLSVLDQGSSCVCLGARTGQEVAALRQMGFKNSIGIDLVPFPPYTIEGDFHNLPMDNSSVSLIYTNSVDHVREPLIWSTEINRVVKAGGFLIMNLQVGLDQDSYTVFSINSTLHDLIEPFFSEWNLIKNEGIPLNIHAMNWEIVLSKIQ